MQFGTSQLFEELLSYYISHIISYYIFEENTFVHKIYKKKKKQVFELLYIYFSKTIKNNCNKTKGSIKEYHMLVVKNHSNQII